MSISVFCPQCKETYHVKDELAGKRGKCRKGHVLVVPELDAGVSPFAFSAEETRSFHDPKSLAEPISSGGKGRASDRAGKSCPSCRASLSANAVLCVGCGFDLRTGKKLSPAKTHKAGTPTAYLLAGGVAAVLAVIAIGAALFFLWPRGSATPQLAQKDAMQKPLDSDAKSMARLKAEQDKEAARQAEVARLKAEQDKEAARQAEVARLKAAEGKEAFFDVNSKLTLANVKAVKQGARVMLTADCSWSSKPNPNGYATGKYRFETPVSEVNGVKVKTPDIQEVPVQYDATHSTVSFTVTPESSLNSVAALIGNIQVRVGDSNALTIEVSQVTAGVIPDGAKDTVPFVLGAEQKKLVGTWSATSAPQGPQEPAMQFQCQLHADGTLHMVAMLGGKPERFSGKWRYEQGRLSFAMDGRTAEPLPFEVKWVNADEFTTTAAGGATTTFRRAAKGSEKPAGAVGERDKLLAQLIAEGDKAFATDPKSALAYNAYSFASRYAQEDKRVKDKLRAMTKPDGSVTANAKRFSDIFSQSHSASFAAWQPEAGESVEATELRLLLNRDLVGDLRTGTSSFNLEGRTVQMNFFLHKPGGTVEQVRKELGKPSSEMKHKGGDYSLTYGRFRINVQESGKIVGVLYVPY